MSTVEVETGRYVKRFGFWNPSTWSIPALYWDTFSQEQRIHAICRQLGKVIAYTDYLGVNVDDIAARLKAIEDGQLDELIVAAIEAWFEENQPEIIAAIEALDSVLPISEFDDVNTVKAYIDSQDDAIAELLPSSDFSSVNTVKAAIGDVAESVTGLQAIINSQLDIKAFSFPTVADMVAESATLFNGAICHTDGFYTSGDDGAAWYEIKSTGTDNAMDVIACGTLHAHLVVENETVKLAQLGITGASDATAGINYALANYKTVICSEFTTYNLSDVVYLKDDVTLAGRNTTFSWSNDIPDNTHWRFGTDTAASGFKVTGIKFDIAKPSVFLRSMSIIDAQDWIFEDCEFTNGNAYMFRVTGTVDGRFSRCSFHDILSGTSAQPAGAIHGQDITRLRVESCDFSNMGDHAIYLDGDTVQGNVDVSIANCNFTKTGVQTDTNGSAIAVYSNTRNLRVNGNSFTQCAEAVFCGYHGAYTTVPTNVVITGNTIKSGDGSGIVIHGGASEDGHFVSNVTVTGNSIYDYTSDGMQLRSVRAVTVSGNCFANCGRSAIEACNVQSVAIAGNSFNAAYGSGLHVINLGANRLTTNTCTRVRITGNVFFNLTATSHNAINSSDVDKTCVYVNNSMQGTWTSTQGSANTPASIFTQPEQGYERSIAFINNPSNLTQKHGVGDIAFNSAPAASGSTIMWVCTTEGTPGTWTPVVTN